MELGPVGTTEQTQLPFDLFLIFAGANIVATTLQIGASLPQMPLVPALTVIAVGALAGALLVGLLAPVGSRLGVPSIVAVRAALGYRGGQAVAAVLFLTNFVWIALNNVIAGSIASRLVDIANPGAWAVVFGIVATLIVLGGPRLVGYADRIAVPMLVVAGIVFTLACLRADWPVTRPPAASPGSLVRGFDVVFGYQTSWLLMFGDYSRYSRSGWQAGVAACAGLGLTALWFVPLGLVASTIAGSSDPGVMVTALGLGWWGGVLVVLATLTTNFVNIYMSALALKSLLPRSGDALTIWIIGGIGSALSVLSTTWLDQMATFTLLLAGVFVPVGGVLIAHFLIRGHRGGVDALYATGGAHVPSVGAVSSAGVAAWAAGAVVFYLAQPIGGVFPSLATSIAAYLLLTARLTAVEPAGPDPRTSSSARVRGARF